MTAAPVEPEWEPGVPLYDRSAHPNSCYLFNFRPDSEAEVCGCPDAADWPGQNKRPLPPGVRADRAIPGGCSVTVYVDDMRRVANLTGRSGHWSHLMAALDLGLREEWIQHAGTHREHFDVTETVRQRAIAAGIAEPISYPRGTGALLAKKRAATPHQPATTERPDRTEETTR